jgi:hypothetical protein
MTVEGQRWLDKPGYKLEQAMATGFNMLGAHGRGLQNLLHGMARPSDPALVLDGVDAAAPRARGVGQAADRAVGIGIVGGIGACGDRCDQLAVHT